MVAESKKMAGDMAAPGESFEHHVVGESEAVNVHMQRDFGIWGLISVSWNMVNVFGGLSYIVVVGFSAGGLPTIFYG